MRGIEENDIEDKWDFALALTNDLELRVWRLWVEAGEPWREPTQTPGEQTPNTKAVELEMTPTCLLSANKFKLHTNHLQSVEQKRINTQYTLSGRFNPSLMCIISSTCHLEWHVYFYHPGVFSRFLYSKDNWRIADDDRSFITSSSDSTTRLFDWKTLTLFTRGHLQVGLWAWGEKLQVAQTCWLSLFAGNEWWEFRLFSQNRFFSLDLLGSQVTLTLIQTHL